MGKAYRYSSVRKAVAEWRLSEWFSAQELLPKAVECLPQKHCSITVYGVSAMLRRLEGRGLLESHTTGAGVKEYRRVESEWES
tara:strand:- start:8454 stop:8702 length:249 start_codon:yes stop_codon:yes gene_type:complete